MIRENISKDIYIYIYIEKIYKIFDSNKKNFHFFEILSKNSQIKTRIEKVLLYTSVKKKI